MDRIYLTKTGYQKLTQELEFLKTVRRRELSKAIGEAIAHGDISENAEYDYAKDAQALNEIKISNLEEQLSRAQILDNQNIPKDRVIIGATVKLKNLDTEEELQYTLVSELESDYTQNKISITSPVGKGLVGHKENEIVEIHVPAGISKYKILQISRCD